MFIHQSIVTNADTKIRFIFVQRKVTYGVHDEYGEKKRVCVPRYKFDYGQKTHFRIGEKKKPELLEK